MLADIDPKKKMIGIAAGVVILACIVWLIFGTSGAPKTFEFDDKSAQFIKQAHDLLAEMKLSGVEVNAIDGGKFSIFGEVPTTAIGEELKKRISALPGAPALTFELVPMKK